MDAEVVLEQCRMRREQGHSPDEIVEFLHGCGLTITESIKVIRQTLSITLGEAKEIVSRHPCWKGAVDAAQPLHERLAKAGGVSKRAALATRRPLVHARK